MIPCLSFAYTFPCKERNANLEETAQWVARYILNSLRRKKTRKNRIINHKIKFYKED